MKFMQSVIDDSMEIWQECANERFLNEIADGSLSKEKFAEYLIQDSLYLRDYLKVFAFAITKANSLKEMQLYYSLLGYVNDGENATRLNYLKEFNLTDADIEKMPKRKACVDYCSFLIKSSKEGDNAEILMAMLPCMLGYGYVFEELKKRAPKVMQGYFAPLVSDYTTDGYRDSCNFWIDYTDEVCKNLSEERKDKLLSIFRQASLHELYFWQMAGNDK